MINLEEILEKLVDGSGRSIQCSVDKGRSSEYCPLDIAKEAPFVKFGNSYFIPSVSIDIDTHQDHEVVLDTCEELNLPYPTIIVNTTKGLHVHWVLKNPIPTRNERVKFYYHRVIDALITEFGGDNYAVMKNAGRMFRNPLQHPTKLYNDRFLSLNHFSDFVKLYNGETIKEKPKRKKEFVHHKTPDFSKVTEGTRNNVLFDYVRAYAYRNAKAENLRELLEVRINAANNKIPEPLSSFELGYIVKSVESFTRNKYVNKTTNKNTIEFNRRVAKKKRDAMQDELLVTFFENPKITLKLLRKMSLREGARLFGVHKNTYKKHLSELVENIKKMAKVEPETHYIVENKPEIISKRTCIAEYNKPVNVYGYFNDRHETVNST